MRREGRVWGGFKCLPGAEEARSNYAARAGGFSLLFFSAVEKKMFLGLARGRGGVFPRGFWRRGARAGLAGGAAGLAARAKAQEADVWGRGSVRPPYPHMSVEPQAKVVRSF